MKLQRVTSDGMESPGLVASKLPPEIVDRAVAGLCWVSLFTAVTSILLTAIEHLLQPEFAKAWQHPVLRIVSLFVVFFSIGFIVVQRAGWLRKDQLLNLGMFFQVTVAFSCALFEGAAYENPNMVVLGHSGIAIWMMLCALLMPNAPLKTAVTAALCVLMWPLGYWVDLQVFGYQPMPLSRLLVWVLPLLIVGFWMCLLNKRVLAFYVKQERAEDVGSYVLDSLLANGGMGEVWRAKHRMLARQAAVKLIRPQVLLSSTGRQESLLRRRFEREAHATASLRSPHTVALYDFGLSRDGSFYYAMELLEGVDLQTLVDRFGPMEPARVRHILYQACKSLDEAHRAGLVHRDIKPRNIMLCKIANEYDFTKVLDFGLVKSMHQDREDSIMTVDGVTTGTPAYLPPEMALGARDVDGRADLYSLGCVGYFLLTGSLVFEESTPVALAIAHTQKKPVPVSQRAEVPVPAGLEAIVMELLEKDPANRIATAAETGRRLRLLRDVPEWCPERAAAWWETNLPETQAQPIEAARQLQWPLGLGYELRFDGTRSDAFFLRIDDNCLVRNRAQTDRAWVIFAVASSLMVAHQVAGKALRDGLFLSRFAPSDLPKVVAAAAVVSVLLGLGFARILASVGPLRVVPLAFGAGSLLHLTEFVLLRSAADGVRAVVITLVYLHLVGFGAILLSGFWSVANEYFDPREAKLRFGRIGGAGTAGGVAGGLLAERTAALFGVDAVLLLLTALHLAVALVLWRVPPDRNNSPADRETGPVWQAARDAFRQAPFLTNLAVLVLLGTMSAAVLDYLFKSGAAAQFGRGPALTRYFAVFYTANQVLTFAVQAFLAPVALRRLGLGKTVGWHPAAIMLGSVASLAGPRELMAPLARGLELVLRGSFLRSGYELFFTPVPPREKRAVKTFIDVGCDRMGDAFGAGVLYLMLLLGPQRAVTPLLVVALCLAAGGLWITRRMDAAYVAVLKHGLMSRAVAVNEAEIEDSTTLAVLRTIHMPATKPERTAARQPSRQTAPGAAAAAPAALHDAVLARLAEMRSGIPRRVAAALGTGLPFDSLLVPQAIRLLAWNEAMEWSRAFLLLHAHRAVGQLVDALLDPAQDFAVRRRIPRILAYTSSQRAVDGLTEVLGDTRFEIRYHASRALEFLHRMGDGLQFQKAAMMSAVERELSIARPAWEGRKLLDAHDDGDQQYWFLDDVLKDRASKSLELVFSLLALHLPAEPLKVAFRALHSEDRMLRGLALEYLESHVPGEIVSKLAALAEPASPGAARPAQEVLEELMASQQTILLSISDRP